MNPTIQDRLHRFATTLLERRGAVVDWPERSDHGLAILPETIALQFGAPEEVALHHAPNGSGLAVNLASEFLDHVGPLVTAEPLSTCLQAPGRYLKKGDLGEAVARSNRWINAKVTVRSEDLWECLLTVHLTASSGAEVDLPDPLRLPDAAPRSRGATDLQTPLREQAIRRAFRRLEGQAAPFVERMEARLERDRQRLRGYYGALLDEQQAPGRARKEASPEEQEARRRAVDLELRRKLAELQERYAIGARLTPVALIRTEITALAVDCEVLRRKERATRRLYWNPLTKQFEPMRCHACGASIHAVAFSDQQVEPTCPACLNAH